MQQGLQISLQAHSLLRYTISMLEIPDSHLLCANATRLMELSVGLGGKCRKLFSKRVSVAFSYARH